MREREKDREREREREANDMTISRTCFSVNKLNALTWSSVGERCFSYKWFSWGLLPAFKTKTQMSANVHVSDSQWGHFHLRLYSIVLLKLFFRFFFFIWFRDEIRAENLSFTLDAFMLICAHTQSQQFWILSYLSIGSDVQVDVGKRVECIVIHQRQ